MKIDNLAAFGEAGLGSRRFYCRTSMVITLKLQCYRSCNMKMILPPLRERRAVDRLLSAFFQQYRAIDFRKAIGSLCRFYHLRNPKVEWFEYIDWGKTAGKTYENDQIYLVHPENWKKGRKYNSERRWINTVYHEMGHYVFWADAENKADMFASRMVRGLNNHRS